MVTGHWYQSAGLIAIIGWDVDIEPQFLSAFSQALNTSGVFVRKMTCCQRLAQQRCRVVCAPKRGEQRKDRFRSVFDRQR
jgi:hypothetical protein